MWAVDDRNIILVAQLLELVYEYIDVIRGTRIGCSSQ